MPEPKTPSTSSQVDKFRDLARELEADEDEERFEERVRRLATPKPKFEKPKDSN